MQAAVDLSEGRPGEDAEEIRRWGTQRAIALRVVTVLGSVVLGVVIAVSTAGSGPRHELPERIPAWQENLGLGCSIAGVGLTIGTVVWMLKTRRIRSGWTSPVFTLTWRQCRDLHRQLRGRQPVDPGQVPVLRRHSQETIRQQSQVWLFLGVLLSVLGSTLTSQLPWRWPLFVVVAGLLVSVLVVQRRLLRHARAFLATHPGPQMEPTGD